MGKQSRHINIRFFFIKDRKDRNELTIRYCPSNDMIGDFFTKPLQGKKFGKFKEKIMGRVEILVIDVQ